MTARPAPSRCGAALGPALGLALALAAGAASFACASAVAGEAPAAADAKAGVAKPAGEAGPARPGAPAGLQPYAAVRALQALQDQVARGSATAQAAVPKALARAADSFAEADPAVWKDGRNASALALYLFSAGRPSAVRPIADGAALTPEGDRLVHGALAYAEGQDEVARVLLGKLDPRAMPPSLGGHLALVLATLFADKDPPRAAAMLDAARLLVPGTLVEEAALRRQIFLLADPASLDRFTTLSRQYLHRFRGSVFASNFKSRLLSFAVRIATSTDVARLAKLDAIFAELPAAERRNLYLTLARDALVSGRPDCARFAAARAAELGPEPAEAERARLYAAAAAAATDTAPAAGATLAALDGVGLSARDAEIRDAALAVAHSVVGPLGDRGDAPGRDAAAPDASAAALIERAQRAMAAGDALLAPPVTPARETHP